jgi:type I restriction enzyme S subunit
MKEGWQIKPLGAVCERVTVGHVGITAPFYRDEGIIFLRTQNVGKLGLDLGDVKFITPEFHSTLKKSEVRAGDILMSRVITQAVNCALVPTSLGVANCANVVLVRPGEGVMPEFLVHYIRSPIAQKYLLDRKVGSAQLVVNTAVVKEWPVPVPPLPEQQRIVALLDEAFAGLATAKANAERNHQNSRAIFETHLQAVFSRRGEGWVEKGLDEVCTISSTLVDPRNEEFLDLTHVGAGNIESKTGALADLMTARQERLVSGKFYFDKSMVLYSKIRPYLIKVARPTFEGLCSADIYPLSPLPGVVTRDYLFHLLLSKHFTDYAIQGSARAGMPKVNREHLFRFRVWLPDVRVQSQLAAKLDALNEETQRLSHLYERKLAALEELKKTLLQQAFNGEL